MMDEITNKTPVHDGVDSDIWLQDLKPDVFERILWLESIVKKARAEINACDKDYDRYEYPIGQLNTGITDAISKVLSGLIGDARYDYVINPKGGMYES